MKKIITCLLFISLSNSFLFAQPVWQWAKKAGGTTASNNIDVTYGVAKDASNNIYSCGGYQGTATIGSNTWTAATKNAWIAKQSIDGQWLWSVTGGGNITAQAITVDANGDVLVAGSCTGGTTLNGFTINSLGGTNTAMFIAKLNGTTGAVIWAKTGRTPTSGGSVDAFSVTTDLNNNVYVGGRGKGNVTFDGTLSFNSSSSGTGQTLDGYVLKLNSSGTLKFVNRIYGATTGNADKICYGVTTNNAGHVFALGFFQSTIVRLDNTFFASNTNTTSTSNDVYVAKYDTSGTPMAIYKYGNASGAIQDYAYTIKMLNDTIAVFAGQSNSLASLTKININNGAVLNSFNASANGTSAFYQVDKDLNGDVYATGFVSSDNATGQNFGTTNIKTNAQNDILFAKADNTLQIQSAINVGTTSATLTNELGRCLVTINADDNIIGGIFASTATFGITSLTAQGNSDLFIARYAPCAAPLQITSQPVDIEICQFTPANFSFTTNINGNYLWYKDGVVYPGPVTTNTISATSYNNGSQFFAQITSACGTLNTDTVTVSTISQPSITTQPIFNTNPHCVGDTVKFIIAATGINVSYQWRKGNVDIIGATNDTLTIVVTGTSDVGSYNCLVGNQCGSVLSSNGLISNVYSPAQITSTPQVQSICPGANVSISASSVSSATSYQWFFNGNSISGANSFSYDISNMQAINTGIYTLVAYATCGNDTADISTLNLGTTTVLNSSAVSGLSCPGENIIMSVDVTGENLNYQWYYNNNPISGTNNDSLILNSVSSSNSGAYAVNITGTCGNIAAGVTTLAVPSFTTTVTNNAGTLSSDHTNASSYQWVDCDNSNQAIVGETNQSFTPTSNGNYAVLITEGACSQISACTSITSIGIKNIDKQNSLNVYPNPAKDIITIVVEKTQKVDIISVLGETLDSFEVNKELNINLSNYKEGVYFVRLSNGVSKKFIKQ